MSRNIKTIDTPIGSVAYRVKGDSPGPAILFIHGALGDSRLFASQIRHFGKTRKTIAIDLPGHGASSTEGFPDMNDMVTAVESVLAAEGVSSYILAGHSMGGGVSFEIFKRGAPGIKGLVLISTAPVLFIPDEFVNFLESGKMDVLAEFMIKAIFSRRSNFLYKFARKGLESMDPGIIKNDVVLCKKIDYSDILSKIDVPVLLIANKGDHVLPSEKTAAIKDAIPDAELVIYDSKGHVPFFENTVEFNETLDDFLETCISSSK